MFSPHKFLLIWFTSPNLSWYSRKPLVELSSIETSPDIEEGVNRETQFDNPLDRHVDSVLRRPSKLRRTMRGVWSFLKTRESLVEFAYMILRRLYSDGRMSSNISPTSVLNPILRADHRSYIRLLGRWVNSHKWRLWQPPNVLPSLLGCCYCFIPYQNDQSPQRLSARPLGGNQLTSSQW